MKPYSAILPLLVALALAAFASGCHRSPQPSASGPGKQYPVRGKVVSTDPSSGEVTLDGAAIPGFMEAMTMPYKLKNPGILGELHPGDQLAATLYVTDTSDVIDNIVITAQAKPDYKPSVFYHEIKPGDQVPDFSFVNQSGKEIHIDQFKGKVLLVTFIYTRCPLPDFCPRMSQNFAKIDNALAADPALYAKTHLLSISFDPAYDTPAVLRSYGGAYTGNYTQEKFAHWDFAAPSKDEQNAVDKFFDVGVTPEQDRTITHSLSTVVITPEGKIYRWYPTNDWTPDQLLGDVRQLLSKS